MTSFSRVFRSLQLPSRRSLFSSSLLASSRFSLSPLPTPQKPPFILPLSHSLNHSLKPKLTSLSSALAQRLLSTTSQSHPDRDEREEEEEDSVSYESTEEVEETDGWEEEEEAEPQVGDGGDGGGVVFQDVPWGERVLSIAREALSLYDDDIKLYAFKTTPRGYIYVRLDKMTNQYGCPSMEELESYCQEYSKRLDEAGMRGEIPDDLAVEVSSPGAERILRVPDDLCRFKDMAMRVCYVEDLETKSNNRPEKSGIFMLDSIETESETCVWKLATVKENRDPQCKGRPFSRKQRDWRLRLPFAMHRSVTLYLEY